MTRFQATIPPLLLLLATAGCAPPSQCSKEDNCHDVVADDGQPPPPDLPCGGADFLTDDANCGACGHACDVSWPGTSVSSGHCIDGECGPHFEQCELFTPDITCAAICQTHAGRTCMPRGCPGVQNEGVTALIYWPGMVGECMPEPPQAEFVLGCDDPLPYTVEYDSRASCCCM